MRVLLATRHADLRLSIELLLSEEPGVFVVGAASEALGLMALIHSSVPDIVILEWDLPGRADSSLLNEALTRDESPKFIVLTSQPNLEKLIRAGSEIAFVMKGDPPERLLAAFRNTRVQLKSAAIESQQTEE